MKFIVDTMLGKLAKWLRILGYDTVYDTTFDDNNLFFKAHLEKRILLTRDKELANRMNPQFCFYIASTEVQAQLRSVIQKFKLNRAKHIFTRCTICNSLIIPVNKKDVFGKVPDFIFKSTDQFVYCRLCNKIYWQGSHVASVLKILEEFSHDTST